MSGPIWPEELDPLPYPMLEEETGIPVANTSLFRVQPESANLIRIKERLFRAREGFLLEDERIK